MEQVPAHRIDPTCCPICEQANACAMEVAKSQGLAEAESCWCMTASFSPELFANLPESLLGKACICANCARGDLPST
ncbi:MAG: hypothetical protein EB017_14055 [Betaproteobacteria bacterium]|nr:hypothetical protein [Betaproteobacteria bacterium]NCX04128.1 hypothetical protein [Betaproteobacteria bacterium]NDE33023.1 hypothetical protein [Betaproteobacteria bacterium]